MNDTVILRKAYMEDAEEIYRLMKNVYDTLEDKSLFVCDNLEYIKEHIEKKGFGVVAVSGNRIVGSFICRFPGKAMDNLGRDIGLSEKELEKVVHMESAVVDVGYRGKGLQSKMLRYAEGLINVEKYQHLLSTISPYNPASMRSLKKNGYKEIVTKEKYGGLLRTILYKKNNNFLIKNSYTS